jgi:hypothetical protein
MAVAQAPKTKVCTRCKKRKKAGQGQASQFYGDKHMKDGLSSWCKPCTKEYDKAYRERKKAEVKA